MSAEISNGQKLYTVVSRVSFKKKGKAPAYRFLGCGLFDTRLEASRAMRAAGGGKDGHRDDLVVFSLPLNCEEEEVMQPYQATITVYARSQAEADAIAADLVIEN